MRLTLRPRLSSKQPIDAAARPFPRLDTTPPVTKMYFEDISASPSLNVFDWRTWRAQSSISGLGREGKTRGGSVHRRLNLTPPEGAYVQLSTSLRGPITAKQQLAFGPASLIRVAEAEHSIFRRGDLLEAVRLHAQISASPHAQFFG
jgi:hypothetical protein